MGEYISVFNPVPWQMAGLAAFQTLLVYIFVMTGLRIVGDRAFGQSGPQYLILLFLFVQTTSQALTPQQAGFWGTIASGLTLLTIILTAQKVSFLSKLVEGKPDIVTENGNYNKGIIN